MTTDAAVLDLRREDDGYIGWCVNGRGERIFGGATLAHSVRAAELTVGGARRIDALHALFLSPGSTRSPVRYRPSYLKRGRSIDVVSVEAAQADRVILTAHVTFHDGDDSSEYQDAAPAVPRPGRLGAREDLLAAGGEAVRRPFEVRPVPRTGSEPRLDAWIRLRDAAEPASHAALLAYAMDFLITRAAHVPLDPAQVNLIGASLDHAMWFHRPFDVREWLLVSSTATTFSRSRSLCHAEVFDESGRLVATGAQEAYLPPVRTPRPH